MNRWSVVGRKRGACVSMWRAQWHTHINEQSAKGCKGQSSSRALFMLMHTGHAFILHLRAPNPL